MGGGWNIYFKNKYNNGGEVLYSVQCSTLHLLLAGKDDTVVLGLEPLLGVGLGQLVLGSELTDLAPPRLRRLSQPSYIIIKVCPDL